MSDRKTNVADFIGECNAGILQEKLALALSDAAMAQLNNGVGSKKAKVSLEFTFQQMGDNDQVIVSHKLTTSNPTKRGKKYEEDMTDTAFFVGKGGVLTIEPPKEDDSGQFNLQHEQVDRETGEIKHHSNVRRLAN
ncbi:translation elongation factor [Vibrio phage vB_ValP_FGH]|nr:translation elongation factor [Vibrio phage vB_ValP_FGH]